MVRVYIEVLSMLRKDTLFDVRSFRWQIALGLLPFVHYGNVHAPGVFQHATLDKASRFNKLLICHIKQLFIYIVSVILSPRTSYQCPSYWPFNLTPIPTQSRIGYQIHQLVTSPSTPLEQLTWLLLCMILYVVSRRRSIRRSWQNYLKIHFIRLVAPLALWNHDSKVQI